GEVSKKQADWSNSAEFVRKPAQTKRAARKLPFCARGGRPRFAPLLGRLFLVRVRELLANPRRFARPVAQVIELGATDIPLALDLDRGQQRRIGLKRALDAFPARDLA